MSAVGPQDDRTNSATRLPRHGARSALLHYTSRTGPALTV
jgi:hypothetical protein